MHPLDDYATALLAADEGASEENLALQLRQRGPAFPQLIHQHGLGPLWHLRTGAPEFQPGRMQAEALYTAQSLALQQIDAALTAAGIPFVVTKGVANRELLYPQPAMRICGDIDLLVHPDERVRAAGTLQDIGYQAHALADTIGHEITLARGPINVDLHWGLLRTGRVPAGLAEDMLVRRRKMHGISMLSATDALFLLLVHPAFAKHAGIRAMGLIRVLDVIQWLRTQPVDRDEVCALLERCGVSTAAWTILRWAQLVSGPQPPAELAALLERLRPGPLRRAYLDYWLRNDLPDATSGWPRLLGFSLFLHDTPADMGRALAGWQRAQRQRGADLAAFGSKPAPEK